MHTRLVVVSGILLLAAGAAIAQAPATQTGRRPGTRGSWGTRRWSRRARHRLAANRSGRTSHVPHHGPAGDDRHRGRRHQRRAGGRPGGRQAPSRPPRPRLRPRLRAPGAGRGGGRGGPPVVTMVKGENGVWSGTTIRAVKPGAWRYNFTVDGVTTVDARNVNVSPKSDASAEHPLRTGRFRGDPQRSAWRGGVRQVRRDRARQRPARDGASTRRRGTRRARPAIRCCI